MWLMIHLVALWTLYKLAPLLGKPGSVPTNALLMKHYLWT